MLKLLRRLLVAGFAMSCAWSQDPLDIIRKSLDRDEANSKQLRNYTYQERQENREYDGNGQLKKDESETHEIMILSGISVSRLIAKNGQPLSAKDAQKEQERIDAMLRRRQNLSPEERARIEKNREKRRAEDRKFLNEIPDAWTLRLLGEEKISGKPAWVIEADPKPGFHPKDLNARILSKVRVKIWIVEGEYQWVKCDAQALDTISMGLALFRVAAGGSFHLEQVRVNDEVWLPSQLKIHADARLAYVKKVHADIDITYKDYKKFQSDSRIVSMEEKPH